MLSIKTWALTLGSFFGLSFTICVLGGVIGPGLPIPHRTLEAILPGFVWISPEAFALGLLESIVFGLYAGAAIVLLHNFFAPRTASRAQGRSQAA